MPVHARPRLALWITVGLLIGCSAKRATAQSEGRLIQVPSQIATGIKLQRLHRGLRKPVGLEFFADDEKKRLFVVEQTGTIRAIEKGSVAKTPMLDISDEVSRGAEQGLLGLAFHPQFKRSRRLFVNFTDKKGTTRIVEYRAGNSDPLQVDERSAKLVLAIKQPWANHNGGYLEFGPDAQLYVGMGDGGAANDPKGAGQNARVRLGKMLRIDVETGKVTTIQSGLRNPWRFSFDDKNGDLYIGDVGQNKWEEINVVAAKDIVGANFGWSIWEGKHCFRKKNCSAKGMTMPAVEYGHETGCSVTGGVVYRGKLLPKLDGVYFYSDYCTAIVRSFKWSAGAVSSQWDWKKALDPQFRLSNISAIADDSDGEIYFLSTDGLIYKLVPVS